MPFRIVDQAPQFLISAGTKVLAGGTLTFYQSGTSVLQDTYTDPTLVTKNTNPVTIGADGRTPDVWGSGNYRVVAADVLGAIQWTRDNVLGPADIPAQAGKSGDLLTTDGANLSWVAVTQLPSVTGQAGKLLSTDGTNLLWQTPAAAPTAPITVATDSVKFGSTGGVAWYIQKGTDTGLASGTFTITKSVTFPTPFLAVPFVSVTVETAYTGGPVVAYLASPPTATGFSVTFDVAEGNPVNSNMNSNVPFAWLAQGTVSA